MFRTLIYIHHQQFTSILLNYHISLVFFGSMCVGVSVWLGWSSMRISVVFCLLESNEFCIEFRKFILNVLFIYFYYLLLSSCNAK